MLTRIKNTVRRKMSDGFIKSIITLASGSLLAQVITMICSPMLTRIYTEEQIGYFTFITSIVAIFSVVIDGRYDVSIVAAHEKKDVAPLAALCCWICGISCCLITIGSYVYVKLFNNDFESLKTLIWFVWPLLVVNGAILIFSAYNNRTQDYKIMTSAQLSRSIGQNVLTILLGLTTELGAFGLLVSQVIGQTLGLRRQSKPFLKNWPRFLHSTKEEIFKVAHSYKNQPLYSVPASLVNALSYSFIGLNIGGLYGMSILGLYAISIRILGLPLGIFSANIAKVHYQKSANEIEATGSFRKSTRDTLALGCLLAIPMGLGLVLLAPAVFAFVFGENWRQAGVYVQYLAPMYCFRMITGTIGYTFTLANKQGIELVFQSCLLGTLLIISIITNICELGISLYLIIIAITYSFIYLVEIISMARLAGIRIKHI